MSAIYLLIAVSLIVAIGFLAAFLWSVKDGQYDDDVSPSVRILLDNDQPKSNKSTKTE
jgi:cbb3-type cytochrome oxidase maturation protein